MIREDLQTLDKSEIDELIAGIPFFKELKLNDSDQYKLLLSHSTLLILNPGDVLLRKGDIGKEVYFLADGYLDVFAEEKPGDKALNQLGSGEVIGGLSIINDQPRTATLAASMSHVAGPTKVLATDFSFFGSLNDFSNVTLQTKINFLRLVITNIRFKINTYQIKYPNHRLAKSRYDLEGFSSESDTLEELNSLADQAFVLTQLLDGWNEETESTIAVPKVDH